MKAACSRPALALGGPPLRASATTRSTPAAPGSHPAALTLASPIDHFGFSKSDGTPLLDAFHLGGMTVNGDVLQLVPFLTNDFAHRDSDISLVAAPIIAQASGAK